MKYIALPEELVEERPLSFYLAMEEYVTRLAGESDLLFTWQTGPSVIYGRNQLKENEVDVDYCEQRGIRVYQRKSGGGCVYSDWGNIMISYVTHEDAAGKAFYTFINMITLTLRRMGIEATSTSHNDVLINGQKVSGTACRRLPEGCIVHGTLLYDTDMENMLRAITPSREKLERKGVESVRQRITLLKDFTTMTIGEVRALIRQTLCVGELRLTEDDVAAIEALTIELY